MTIKNRIILTGLSVLLAASSLPAQQNMLDLYGGLVYTKVNPLATTNAKLSRENHEGWVGSVNLYANKWFGFGSEISAVFGDLNPPGGEPAFNAKQYSYLFGPQFRFVDTAKVQTSFRWLIGGAFAQVNQPSSITAAQIQSAAAAGYSNFNQTKFAMLLAVPVDLSITKAIAIRFEPGLYMTDFNQTKQSNLRFSVGPVFRFGER